MTALRRVDWRLLALWALPATGVAYGLGYAGLAWSTSRRDPADILAFVDEFLAACAGAAVGLALAGCVGAALARPGARMLTGSIAAVAAYCGGVLVSVANGSLEQTAHPLLLALGLLAPAALCGLAGGLLGALVADRR